MMKRNETRVDMKRLPLLIQAARKRIREAHAEAQELVGDLVFRDVDAYLGDTHVPDLEKALYLLLNQFPGDHQDYFVVPRTRVRVPEVYRLESPDYCDYEIDFAVYSGSQTRPIKIAIECDGIRSHRERHGNRDRRKDVNLQAAGWTVLRFGSREIEDELQQLIASDTHINKFVTIIENVVAGCSDLLTPRTYHRVIEKLTGYRYAIVVCPGCGHKQWDACEITTHCRMCRGAIRAGMKDE